MIAKHAHRCERFPPRTFYHLLQARFNHFWQRTSLFFCSISIELFRRSSFAFLCIINSRYRVLENFGRQGKFGRFRFSKETTTLGRDLETGTGFCRRFELVGIENKPSERIFPDRCYRDYLSTTRRCVTDKEKTLTNR